ncbi:MAG: NosD domain-containing protein [Methanomassiliicoccales archaeon]
MTTVKARCAAGLLILFLLAALTPLSLMALPVEGGGLGEAALGGPSYVMIDGDSDLASQAAMYSWPGDGTPSNPYTISNTTLICNDSHAAIDIINTTKSIAFYNITVLEQLVEEYHQLVILNNVTGVRLEGVQARVPNDESVSISKSTDLVIEDCFFGTLVMSDCSQVFIGNSTVEWTNGFRADRCHDFQLLGNTFDHVSFFILRDCERFTFAHNTFNYVVYGFTFTVSNNMTLWSNTFLDCSLCALRDADRLWNTDSFHTLIAPSNNTVNGLPLMFLRDMDMEGANLPSGAGQILLVNVSNAVLSGQSFSSISNALTAVGCHNLTVSSNSITWTLRGIMVDDSDGVHLQSNILDHCYDGIVAKRCGELVISDNWLNGSYRDVMVNMPDAGDYAILLTSQDNGQISDNIIGSYWWGPTADGSSGVEFSGNEVVRAFYGLLGMTSHHLIFSSNTVSNADYGIILATVHTSTMVGNTISGGDVGFLLNNGDGNRITENRITGCSGYGINAYSTSSGNVILGNILRNNHGAGTVYSSSTVQAKDDGSGNAWSSAWSGGNKWGEWSSPDADNDTYVDTPYAVGGKANARDYYPYASHTTVVDDTPPSLVITSPANGSWQTSLRGYFYWQGSDAQTSIYKYFGNLGNSGWFDLGQRTDWNRTLGEGRQEMAFMAVDMAGNRVIRQVVIFIDTRAPFITVGSIGPFIPSPDVWVNWTVADPGIGLDTVELSLDGGDWTDVTNSSSYLLTGLSESTVHNIRLKATDLLGLSRTVYINTTVDTVYDHLEILSPNGELTNDELVTVEWEAYDLVAQTSHVEISVDGQAWFTVTGSRQGLSGLSDGEHTIQVRAWDHAGNSATRSTTVVIDRTAPALLISSPLPGAVLGSSDVQVEWECSDAHGFTCQWRSDGGEWTVVTDDFAVLGLTDGTHTIELSCCDGAGNFANGSVDITIDTHRPVVSITSPYSGEHLGTSAVTVTWEVGDISEVEMSWRIDESDWSVAQSSTVVISDLSDGAHVFELSCRDSVGLYTNLTLEFTVDTTAPSVTIVSPGEGRYSNRSIEVVWEASDLEGIDHFRLGVDSSWTDLPGDVFTAQLNGLTDSPHTIVVTAFDEAGNSNSTEITIWIDTVAPYLQIISPSNNSFGNSISLTVAWAVSDPAGIGSIYLCFDGSSWMNVTSVSSYAISLSEGAHIMTFNVTDALGNFAVRSVTHTVDLTSPVIEITSPTEGAFLGPSVRVSWEAGDDRGISRFVTSVDGGPWQEAHASSRSMMVNGLLGGGHTVEVRVIDLAGNVFSDSVTFEVDSTAPLLSVTSPANPTYTNNGTIEVAWVSFDNGTGIAFHSVSCDGSSWTDVNGTSYTLDLLDGTYTITVRAYDLVGNRAEMSLTVVVDTARPSVMMISPSDGAFGNESDLIAFWTADDATSGIAYYEISVDGAAGLRVNGTELLIEDLSEGAHTLNVKAYDMAGNVGEDTIDFIIDLTCPLLSITSPIEDSITNAVNISVGWTSSDSVGIAYFEVSLDASAPIKVGSDGSSYDLTTVPEGHHQLTVEAFDVAGNSRSLTVSFIVDRTAPSGDCRISGDPHSDTWNVTVEVGEPISTEGTSMSINGMPCDPNFIGPGLLIVEMDAPVTGDEVVVTLTSRDLAGNIAALSWTMEAPFPTLTVSGRVIDENGAIMIGAPVYRDGTLVAEADTQGNFSFDIAPGVHNIVIRMDGHLPANLTLELDGTNGTSIGVIVLAVESEGRSFGSGIGTILIVAILAMAVLVGAIVTSLTRNRKP